MSAAVLACDGVDDADLMASYDFDGAAAEPEAAQAVEEAPGEADGSLRDDDEQGGPSADDRLSSALNNLAGVHLDRGEYDDALRLYTRSFDIREPALGAEHPLVADTLNNLATVFFRTGRNDDSIRFQTRALAIREKAFGEDHPNVAMSLSNLAGAYLATRKFQEAADLLARARLPFMRERSAENTRMLLTL